MGDVSDKFHTPFDLDHENYKRLSIFQYIIGNKDWYVTSKKNIVIIVPEDTLMKPVAVPYDFDFSGLVNAFYSKPRDLPNQTISDRRSYKGICYTKEELKAVIDYFRKLKPVFRAIVKNEKALDEKSRLEVLQYLNYSFSLIGTRYVRKQFLEVCETKKLYNIKE